MTGRPKFKLSRLREIGWAKWDPIGLSGTEDWSEDEYDSYLLQAAGRLWNGESRQEVTSYLVSIETEYMGLGEAPGIHQRANEFADALSNYVTELRA
ncbi:hypothetical protein [Altererythrobacter ishigakiensis]|uniref:Uncharacterized protein n=1 Tax=Altererythrobacter ishigakiensis TaxID=476157 RepID=A0A562UTC4_9SPHN|nr:hypothetical protein [Altererythrobacter ishigakiensis]TWJ08884.1 hypothetical protein JN10_0504 [Altererythrobacter ishigakiensis]